MDQENSNVFTRQDTFFGICEAIGQDFGFNPLWLRLAFIAPLFFFPVQTFAVYFGLGLMVYLSRVLFPVVNRKPAAVEHASVDTAPVAPASATTKDTPPSVADDFAIAA